MQNSISRFNEILFNCPPRSKTADKIFKDAKKIEFQPTMYTLPYNRSISKEKHLNNDNSHRFSKTEDKFYLVRASQPLNNIVLDISHQIEKPEISIYKDLTHYRNPIRNVAYAKIMQKYDFFHTRNASRAANKTPEFYGAQESHPNQIKTNKNLKQQSELNSQKYPRTVGRSPDKNKNFSLMNFKSDKKKSNYRTKSIPVNQGAYEESVVFKINPYLDSSSKYILDKFRESIIKKSNFIQNSKINSKIESEAALRYLIPLFSLKFAENKTFFRKILQNPSIMEKEKKLQEKIHLNKERYKRVNPRQSVQNKNKLFVYVKKKGSLSSKPLKNEPLIHQSSKIDLNKIVNFGDINIKQW